jgi:hypothetical protein
MALPRVPVATTADQKARPLIRFDARRTLLDAANKRMQGRFAITPVDGLSLQVTIAPQVVDAAGVRTAVNRLLRNAAATLVDRATQINRRVGYDTGLMSSSWKGKVTGNADKFTILLSNPTPYAAVAKRAGSDWRAGRTILNTYIRPMLVKARKEIGDEVKRLIERSITRSAARSVKVTA